MDEVADLLKKEKKRQREGLVLIPSENYISDDVLKALGSEFSNKYAEGQVGKRYYTGNEWVDEVEKLAINRVKKLFGVPFVNVQALSGSPANLAILTALCKKRSDSVLSQELSHGGHLSMGQKVSVTGRFFKTDHYGLSKDGEINWKELAQKAKNLKPRVIFAGGTAYTKKFDFKKYADIAQSVGAYFVADVSHIAGLIVAGVHPDPVVYADLVMTTSHKTLRGGRGAIIMVTKRGLAKDPQLGEKINKAVFPGLQGGPHMNNIASIAVALKEASTSGYKKYARRVVRNAKALAESLVRYDFDLVGGGTENHMIWINLSNKKLDGWSMHAALEMVNIFTNKQTVPGDKGSAFYPSGLRLGTPAVTTRGMQEAQMRLIAQWVNTIAEICQENWQSDIGDKDQKKDQRARRKFKDSLKEDKSIKKMKKEVKDFAKRWPIFKW
jgi:glycine hydroxymethyltransferase